MKDLLSIVSRRTRNEEKAQSNNLDENNPKWMPITFNLKTEIPKFVSYYQQRDERYEKVLFQIRIKI